MAFIKNARRYTVEIDDGATLTHTISTTVTSHPGAARDWIHHTLHQNRRHRHRLIIGLGIQWVPYFHHNYDYPASTIQLCVGRRCLIFQLDHSPTVPRVLRRLLSDPANTFVGLWNHNDRNKLRQSKHELDMDRGMPIDLRLHVDVPDWVRRSSISEIVKEVVGFDMGWDEEISNSNWNDVELSYDQIRQASLDAYASFVIGMKIQAWNLNYY